MSSQSSGVDFTVESPSWSSSYCCYSCGCGCAASLLFRLCKMWHRIISSSSSATTSSIPRLSRLLMSPASTSSFSTAPERLVSNVTVDKLASGNAELEAYMKANFPAEMDPTYEPVHPPHHSRMNSFGLLTEEQANEESTDAILAKTVTGMQIAPELHARNIRPMITYLRDAQTEANSRRARFLRYHRLIPGLLYGGDPTRGIFSHQPDSKTFVKTPWRFLERELDRFHHSVNAHVYALTVLEKDDNDNDVIVTDPQLVVPADIQRHPVQEKIYCANFLRYHPGRPLKLPLVHINQEESPALKRDGYLLPIQRRIECFVDDGVPIPPAIELECTGLKFRDVVRKDRLVLPDGVRLSDRVQARGEDFIVAVVDGRGRAEE